MTAAIIGWAHSQFGKLGEETVESLIVDVANRAVADAGLEARDVDQILLGHFNGGFSAQDFTASLVLQADPDFRFKPALRVGKRLRHRLRRRPPGPHRHRRRQGALRPGRRRRADDDDTGPGHRPLPFEGLLP